MVLAVKIIKMEVLLLYRERSGRVNIAELIGPIEDSNPSRPRKAILWGREDLLVKAVELFLDARADWEVIRVSSNTGVDDLVQQIKRVKPDVVILCQGRDASDSALPMQLIQDQDCIKVVSVSLESNFMQVYSKYSVLVHNVSDLLSVIETRHP